jgi:hypothetical protein
MRGIFIAAKAELFQNVAGLIVVVTGAESGFDISQRRGEAGKIRLLRQIADGRTRLHKAAAAVGFDKSGGDLQ